VGRNPYAAHMTEFEVPVTWDRAGLESVGFHGFVPLIGLDLTGVPQRRGIYAIVRQSVTMPSFVATNPVVKKRLYSVDALMQKWIPASSVVYIGKAEPVNGLSDRLRAFSRMASNHSGGRAIWQLTDAAELLVGWLETPDNVAEMVEKSYLRAFRDAHGGLPFANWRL
jgi:hypothetical protein